MKKQGLLNVSGEGRIQLPADVAEIRLTVVAEAKSAGDAAAGAAERATAVIARTAEIGIARSAMRTEGLGLYPVYASDPQTGASVITGYRAEDTVVVKASIDLAGKVFDAGIEAGANQSSGISFGVADAAAHRQAALEAAVKAARADAEAVARAMGVELEGLRSVDIDPASAPSSPRMFTREASATPVLPGVITVIATVRAAFEVRASGRKEKPAKAPSKKKAAVEGV